MPFEFEHFVLFFFIFLFFLQTDLFAFSLFRYNRSIYMNDHKRPKSTIHLRTGRKGHRSDNLLTMKCTTKIKFNFEQHIFLPMCSYFSLILNSNKQDKRKETNRQFLIVVTSHFLQCSNACTIPTSKFACEIFENVTYTLVILLKKIKTIYDSCCERNPNLQQNIRRIPSFDCSPVVCLLA